VRTLPGPGDDLAERGAARIREATDLTPRTAIILGSGLGSAVDAMEVESERPYAELPGFPAPSVPGHAGRVRLGTLAGVPVVAFLGRIHFYEGHPMELVTLPVRLAAALGARTLVATAAVGALDTALAPGTLVVGQDHLSFLGQNPLRGWRGGDGGPPFVNPEQAYDRELAEPPSRPLRTSGFPPRPACTPRPPGRRTRRPRRSPTCGMPGPPWWGCRWSPRSARPPR
jgi:purine-nucleoside phosphorylase